HDRWWPVDVTWNAAGALAGGRELPVSVRSDVDYRRRYVLSGYRRESTLVACGLLPVAHDTDDATPVDYLRTLDAYRLIDAITGALAQRRKLHRTNDRGLARIDGRIATLYRRYQRLAAAAPLAIRFSLTMTPS